MTGRADSLLRGLPGVVAAAAGVFSVLAAPAALLGAENTETLPVPPATTGPAGVTSGAGGALLRLGIGLVVVVALVLAVWWVLKRTQRRRFPEADARDASLIDVMATAPLGPNRTLHLVRLGDEIVMVGATDHSITPVAHLTPDQVNALALSLGAPDARGAFGSASGAGRRDAGSRPPAYGSGATLVERLRAMTARR